VLQLSLPSSHSDLPYPIYLSPPLITMVPVKTAVVLPDGAQIDLIIPLSSGTTLNTLQEVAVERAARHHPASTLQSNDILLQLESQAGPFLHPDDKVEDVISARETVYVVLKQQFISAQPSRSLQAEPSMTSSGYGTDFQLRVITPHLAHCHEDIRTIPLLGNGRVFPASSTLRELREAISNSLDVTLGPGEPQSRECNCKIAEVSSDMASLSAKRKGKILVVSGFSNVTWVDVLEPTHGSIMASLKQYLGETFEETKTIHLKGGDQNDDDLFTLLPVVSVCEKSRHSDVPQSTTASSAFSTLLDLHTAEGPIETPSLDFSVEKLGLTDLLVNGVLSIYAIERRASSSTTKGQILGKDAMFSAADCWVSDQHSDISKYRVYANRRAGIRSFRE
jgi:hypothetical protein